MARYDRKDALYRRAESAFSLEGQELLVSLLLEPHGALVDELGESLAVDDDPPLDPTMTVGALARLIESGGNFDSGGGAPAPPPIF